MSLETYKPCKICCEDCGLLVEVPALNAGHQARCPRCHGVLMSVIGAPSQKIFAYGIAAIILLIVSLAYPFISLNMRGMEQTIRLLDTVKMLHHFENGALAAMLLMVVVILPVFYMVIVLFLQYQTYRQVNQNSILWPALRVLLGRILFKIKSWLMVDVFLIGVLVSCIKISSSADLAFGLSFWAFCGYSVLLVKFSSVVDPACLWGPMMAVPELDRHTIKPHYISCHLCLQVNVLGANSHCIRCDFPIDHKHDDRALQKSWAWLLTAIVCYIPANLYPMMHTHSFGHSSGSTILSGVFLLWSMGSYPVALIIFLASVVIPIAKILTLAGLFVSAHRQQRFSSVQAQRCLTLYRVAEMIGKWSMIDIFVVAILVALIQLHGVVTVVPGAAILFFAVVVVSTMLSAMAFDPKIFWKAEH